MNNENKTTEGGLDQTSGAARAGEPGDAKRRARRRFLMRSAAGSGVVVVTLYHQRSALAKKTTIYTSSPEFCASLKGTPTSKKSPASIPNPDNPAQKIQAFECQNVPDYKVPWVPQKK